jgi:hypothetical protein
MNSKLQKNTYFSKDILDVVPVFFHVFNLVLAECAFPYPNKILDDYYLYATILMC